MRGLPGSFRTAPASIDYRSEATPSARAAHEARVAQPQAWRMSSRPGPRAPRSTAQQAERASRVRARGPACFPRSARGSLYRPPASRHRDTARSFSVSLSRSPRIGRCGSRIAHPHGMDDPARRMNSSPCCLSAPSNRVHPVTQRKTRLRNLSRRATVFGCQSPLYHTSYPACQPSAHDCLRARSLRRYACANPPSAVSRYRLGRLFPVSHNTATTSSKGIRCEPSDSSA